MKEIIPFIGVPCFVICTICFVLAYKKRNKKQDFKKMLILGIAFFIITAFLTTLSKKPMLEQLKIKDIEIYKGSEKDIIFIMDPEDADSGKIECSSNDEDIASISYNKITGLAKGSTKYICTFKDDDVEIKSNEANITVKLTDKQIAKIEKEKEKKAEQERKEAEEKAAQAEANKNTLSSEEQAFAKDYAKQCVEKVLKAPSTAEFPGGWLDPYEDWGMSKINNLVTVASYVDSENGFGAMIRSTFRIQMQIDGSTWSISYFEFDGQVISGTYQ